MATPKININENDAAINPLTLKPPQLFYLDADHAGGSPNAALYIELNASNEEDWDIYFVTVNGQGGTVVATGYGGGDLVFIFPDSDYVIEITNASIYGGRRPYVLTYEMRQRAGGEWANIYPDEVQDGIFRNLSNISETTYLMPNIEVKLPCTVTFNANGGSGSTTSVTTHKGETFQTKSASTFTRANYIFLGWSTSSAYLTGDFQNPNTTYTYPSSASTTSLTLYAYWAPQPKDTSKYWGESGTGYDIDWEGSGTQSDPYKIQTAEELAGLSWRIYNGSVKNSSEASGSYYYQNVYFEQTANLDVSAYWWTPIGVDYNRSNSRVSRSFSGHYDGGGHTISGVCTKAGSGNAYYYQGLFGSVNTSSSGVTAEIHNLGVIDSYIQGYSQIGAIVGGCTNTHIYNCYNTSDVNSSAFYAGGIAGYAANTTINNCYNLGNIKASSSIAGGIASYYDGLISNCFSGGNVTSPSSAGAIAGMNTASSSTIQNSYYGGNCALTVGCGQNYGTDGSSRDTSLFSNAKSLSWYQNSSKWNSSYTWDFDTVWTLNSSYNNGFPIFQNMLPKKYYLDVNGNLDGTISGTLENYATFDVYINGSRVAYQVNDYCEYVTYGASYQVTNINYATDKALVGVYHDNECTISGSLSGTMPAERRIVCLKIRTKTWNDYAASSFDSGNGTAASPYIIKTAEQLARLSVDSKNNSFANTFFKLGADIDLSAHVWEGIGCGEYRFVGAFDGDFYTISNIKTSVDYFIPGWAGLFEGTNLSGVSIIKNIILKNGNVIAKNSAGVITSDGASPILNCVVENVNVQGEDIVGGIIGVGYYRVDNCIIKDCTIDGHTVGGLVGYFPQATTCENNAIINTTLLGTTVDIIGTNRNSSVQILSSYAQGSVNGVTSNVMYGTSSDFGNWTYNANLNGGYPVQKTLFHIGGMSGSENVYNYLYNVLNNVGEVGQLFTQVDYIESEGTQYIDTGVKYTNNHSIEVDAELISVDGIYALYGGANSSQQRIWMGRAASARYSCYSYFGSNVYILNTWGRENWLTRHTYSTKKNVTSDGENVTTCTNENFTHEWNMLLLAAYNTDISTPSVEYRAPAKLYGAKIWDENDNLIRDYIPVKNKVTGEYGLFDKVTNTFYGNAGTGSFLGA